VTVQDPQQQKSNNPSAFLLQQWVAAGIVSSAARFIPVPFMDDFVRGQCRRFVISRTLAYHKDSPTLDELNPYYSSGRGFLSSCVSGVARAPLKLLLFPIRKVMAVVTSIRGVPLEILRMVLLGRTLDRYLREDRIKTTSTPIRGLAARMRVAFDEAFARMDFHVVRAAVSDALSGVSGWRAGAIATAQLIGIKKVTSQDDLKTDPQLKAGAERVQDVLGRPETLEIFAQFDRRFDEAFRRNA
jgi:hypothetical protein